MQRSLLIGLLLLHELAALRQFASIVEGYQQEFAYVSRFAFGPTSNTSTVASDNEQPARLWLAAWTFMRGQRLLVYNDSRWFAAYGPDVPCLERASLSALSLSIVDGGYYGRASVVVDLVPQVPGEPQYWHLALARCREWMPPLQRDEPNGIFMYYELAMTNAGGDQFSADEQGLLGLHAAFTGLYGALALAFVAVVLRRLCCRATGGTGGARPSPNGLRAMLRFDTDAAALGFFAKVQLFAALLVLHVAHHALGVARCALYAGDGVGAPWAEHASEAVGVAASVLLTLALLWISKGYTITVTHLKPCARVRQLAATGVLLLLYVVAFVVEVSVRDPAAAYAPHEALAARLLIPLRVVLAVWFARNVCRTLHAEHALPSADARAGARAFYRVLLVAGVAWLLSLPLWHALAAVLPPYVRHRAMVGAVAGSNLLLLALLVVRGTTSFGAAGTANDMLPQIEIVRRL